MNFTEEEVYYLKKLLFKHSLELTDIIMNEEDQREMARKILDINHSCTNKLINL